MGNARLAVVAPSLDLLRRVERLEAIVADLSRRLDQQRRPRDADDLRVLLALASSVGTLRFSARDVLRHATHVAALHEAIALADCGTSRSLGRLLRRVEGRSVEGITLARVGAGRGGWIWALQVSQVCVTAPPNAR